MRPAVFYLRVYPFGNPLNIQLLFSFVWSRLKIDIRTAVLDLITRERRVLAGLSWTISESLQEMYRERDRRVDTRAIVCNIPARRQIAPLISCRRVSLCPSVTSRCSTETAKRWITQTTPHDMSKSASIVDLYSA